MGAFFAAVIRAPFTSIIMIFEMTHDYKIILPLMVANITALALSKKFVQGSIYESISEQDGVHLPSKDDNEVLESLLVEDAMIRDVSTFQVSDTLEECYQKVKDSTITGYPVVKQRNLVGVVSSQDILKAYALDTKDRNVFTLSTKQIITIYPDQSLLVALHRLQRYQVSRVIVVSRLDDRKVVGIITAEDIVSFFGYHINEDEIEALDEEKAKST
jgi:CIC family chloride channel protein